jgi:tol-pal system protein YbgF
MTNRVFRALAAPVLAILLTLLIAPPASAANKEHQQLMADLRMLQEQAQLLQNMIGTLNEALKAVTARLEQQAETNRKSFADEKLLIDTLTKDLSIIREKVDDNNVRVGSLAQEVDALRQLVQQALARQPGQTSDLTPPGSTLTPPAGAGASTPAPPPATTPRLAGASPTKTYEQAYGDYAAGLWDLAIDGFEAFLKDFPTATQADEAQFYIGRAYLQDAKYDKAVEAFDKVIRNYSSSNNVPSAYFLKGVALRSLKQADAAREAWDTVIKKYPDTPAASQAKQALGRP